MGQCAKGYKTSTELDFYKVFGHLMRFCGSVIYFENMNPFADKTQFTDQNVQAKKTKLTISCS